MEKWKQVAMQLVELDDHAKLCCGDVRVSEIYCHKPICYTQFTKRYRSLQQQQQQQKEWIKKVKQFFWSLMHGSRYPTNMVYDS